MSRTLFVGRSAELDWLNDRLAVAVSGRPSIAVVDGPPGIGKSALMTAFLDGLSGARVATASGDEAETSLPYGIVQQLLDRPDSPWEDPFGAGAEILERLDPSGAQTATVLVVDDVHLADTVSMDALTFALRRLAADPVLAVFVVRDDDVWRLPPGLLRLAEAHEGRLHVGGLTDAEVADLLKVHGLADPSGTAAARLSRHTGGNPLYVRALVDELPADALVAGGPLPAPRSYARLVTGALASRSEPAQRLARAASVLPEGAAMDLVAAVANVPDPRKGLEELGRSPTILTSAEGARGWTVRFPHPLVRAAVHADLGPHALAMLHGRAADLLEGDAALLHRVAATNGPDDELADRLAEAAAARLARGDAHAAADLSLQASRVGRPGPVSDERLLDAINLLLIDGDLAATKALAPDLEAAPPTARRVYLQARLAWFAGEPDAAEALATEAWSRSEQLSTEHLGSLAAILAQLHNMRGDGPGAADWAARALALGLPPDLDDSTNAAQALGLGLSGQIDAALAVLDSVPSDSSLVRGYGHQLATRGALRVASDDLVGARVDLATVCNAGGHAKMSPQRLLALGALAEVDFRLGSWDGSLAAADHALSLAEDTEQLWVQGYLHAAAVLVSAGRGDWTAADDHLASARELAERLGDLATLAVCENAGVHVAWCRSDHADVVVRSGLLLALGGGPTHEPGLMQWPVRYLSALVELGRLDEAEAAIEPFEEFARERGCRSRLAALARVRGEIATARRDHDLARTSFEIAVVGSSAVPALDAALSQAAYGRFLRRRGERRAALARLTDARTRLVAMGARPFVDRVDDELAACGVTRRNSALGVLDTLTPQERTVATLVCQGLTNQEVAQQLVLSTKTVGYHLGNVYSKLGVHTRTQLAAAWTADS